MNETKGRRTMARLMFIFSISILYLLVFPKHLKLFSFPYGVGPPRSAPVMVNCPIGSFILYLPYSKKTAERMPYCSLFLFDKIFVCKLRKWFVCKSHIYIFSESYFGTVAKLKEGGYAPFSSLL